MEMIRIKVKHISTIIVISTCFFYTVYPQVGNINGKIVNSAENGINGAKVILLSTLSDIEFKCEDVTNSNGDFKLSFDWKEINDANSRGSEWIIQITKEGYEQRKKSVFIASGEIDPNFFTLILKSNLYDQYSSKVDMCQQKDSSICTLYLFDLVSSNSNSNDIMHRLSYYLKSGMNNFLETNKKDLGNDYIDVVRCSNVPVELENAANYFIKRLDAPGILWGYLEEDQNKIRTDITATISLDNKQLTAFTPISYSKNSDLFSPGQSIDSTYLALTCLVLGYHHLINKDSLLAGNYFHESKKLYKLPKEFSKEVDAILNKLDSSNPATKLTSIEQ